MYQSRTISARDRLSPPGFILPCQPILAREVPTGPEWVHELKWDGYRILAHSSRGVTRLWSRNGRNWTRAFPWIVEVIEQLPVQSVIIDGEAVCLRPDGLPDFHALQSKRGCQDARLIAFDLLGLAGEDLRPMPLLERRRRLADLLSGDPALWFSSHVQGAQGEALFRHACAMNLEGIVSKQIDEPYRSGPFRHWRKIKFTGYVRP